MQLKLRHCLSKKKQDSCCAIVTPETFFSVFDLKSLPLHSPPFLINGLWNRWYAILQSNALHLFRFYCIISSFHPYFFVSMSLLGYNRLLPF